MSPDDHDQFADDSWSDASEAEQQAWLRSALIECDTKPIEVDPRYEIPIEPVDFTAELANCHSIDAEVTRSPAKRNARKPTHCSVSASMPHFNLQLFGNRGKLHEVAKSKTYPRRRSAEGQKSGKKKLSVPGFMRDTEAWSKRRSISSSVSVTKTVSVPSILKRSVSNSVVSKSVCGIPSRNKSIVCQSEIPFKASKARSRSPTCLKSDRHRSLKRKHGVKQGINKRSIHFPIFEDSSSIEIDGNDCVARSVIKDSSKHWDQILTDPDQWSSHNPDEARLHIYPRPHNRIASETMLPQKSKILSAESFTLPKSNHKLLASNLSLESINDCDSEFADDTCLIGLYNDDDEGSFEDPLCRLAEKMDVNSEVEQLRKALSDVSIMYQDQVQNLKRQLFSTLEQFKYDREQIAFLKRKLAENSCIEQVQGR